MLHCPQFGRDIDDRVRAVLDCARAPSLARASTRAASMTWPDDDWSLSNSQITWCSGTVSGFAATLSKQPIQRVKWIRQTSEGPTRAYSAIVAETVQTRGYRGFFAGSAAAVYRNVPHSVLVYSLYPHAAALSRRWLSRDGETFSSRFVAGYMTMVGATVVTHPLDTLRVRVSVKQSTPTSSFLGEAAALRRAEGLAGFYGGFGATLVGAGPGGAIGFGVFETAKPLAAEHEWLRERPALAKVVCGYVAGLCSESIIYPLDTVRRRQQAFGAAHPINRLSVFAALASIFRAEGLGGLFKGISLNLIKNPAATAVSFTVNDVVKDFLGYRADGDDDLRRTATLPLPVDKDPLSRSGKPPP